MDKMSAIALVLVAFPEGALAVSIGLALMNIKPRAGKMLLYGMLHVISAFLIRRLSLPPGIHSVLFIAAGSFFLFLLYRIAYKKAFFAIALAFLTVVLLEALFLPLGMSLLSITLNEILGNPWLRVAVALPQHLFMALVLLIVYRLRGFHGQKAARRRFLG